jgi:hypothetical protein
MPRSKPPADPSQSIMDALMSKLAERQLARMQSGVEREFSRKQIQDAFIETFDLVGGVPRLALWANDPANYKDFITLLMKLAPKEQMAEKANAAIVYQSLVPQSSLVKRNGEQIAEGEFEDIVDGQDV